VDYTYIVKQVFGRYSMGWWPSKIIVLLNIVQMIGYGLIDCVVGGQILSAVSPDYHMSVAVGMFHIAFYPICVGMLTIIKALLSLQLSLGLSPHLESNSSTTMNGMPMLFQPSHEQD
jgi:purine-cytosine permease-like protein